MDTNNKPLKTFGPIRTFFWPIHKFELKKLLPMLCMFFFISFNYSILRNIKDTLVINAAGSPGAEIIPFLKFFGVIPAAIIFMIIFAKLSNILSKPKLFYTSIVPFLLFFSLFTFVLYPLKEELHFLNLQAPLPEGLLAIFRIWTFSLFYIFAELWGSVVLALLFWGFANDTTKVSESGRFYALFGIGANFALEISGRVTEHFATIKESLPAGVDPMQHALNSLTVTYLIGGLFVMAIYWWINRYVLTDSRFYDPTQIKEKKSKPKMSLKDSFKFLFHSKYLLYIALIVIAYGISINLIEVTWKNQVKELYTNQNDYLAFMGQYSKYVGRTTIFLMLFVTGNVIRNFGWSVAALITPITLFISGAAFFTLIIFSDYFSPMITDLGTTTLIVAVALGTFQNVISKASKYALFDPTKEMTYIPLDQESKVKGKAAIDVVGSRLGKAGGSLIQIGLFAFVGPLTMVTSHIAIIVFAVIGVWIYATSKLGVEFAKKNKDSS